MITSTANPRVKELVRLGKRSEREATGRFVVEGVREAGRAVAAGVEVVTLVVCADLVPPGGAEVVRAARATGAEVLEVGEAVFRRVSGRSGGADGVLLVARTPTTALDDLALGPAPLVLVAAGIEKPGNLGAMLRSAAAAGADALVLADPVTDVFNPNAVRASMGALFTVPVGVGTAADVVAWTHGRGLRLVVTTPHADAAHWDAPLAGPVAVVVGSEADGVDRTWFDAADDLVTIPMPGARGDGWAGPAAAPGEAGVSASPSRRAQRASAGSARHDQAGSVESVFASGVDSLNAASTAAVLLFEAVRQRRSG